MRLKLATVQFALRLEDLFCVTNVDQTFFNAAPVIKTVAKLNLLYDRARMILSRDFKISGSNHFY